MANKRNQPVPNGYKVIFVTSYWHKGAGKKIYASDYGLRAFRLVVRK